MGELKNKLTNAFGDKLMKQYIKHQPSPMLYILDFLSKELTVKGISYEQNKIKNKFDNWKKICDTFTIHEANATTDILFINDKSSSIIKLNVSYKDPVTTIILNNSKYYNFDKW